MKIHKPVFILLVLFNAVQAIAQFDTAIHFNRFSYANLFEQAKLTNKPVMLYFHIDGCGSCIQLERGAFAQKDIYSYMNSNLLVYNINTQKGEGIDINKRYQIEVNPTILFLNQDGNIIDRIEGYNGIYNLYTHLTRAVDQMNYFLLAKKEYGRGNRDPKFLYQYSYILDTQGALDSGNVVAEYLATQSGKDLLLEKKRIVYL